MYLSSRHGVKRAGIVGAGGPPALSADRSRGGQLIGKSRNSNAAAWFPADESDNRCRERRIPDDENTGA